jgi:hypothetical protein
MFTLATALAGQGVKARARAAQAVVFERAASAVPAGVTPASSGRTAEPRQAPTCSSARGNAGYVNPLAGAHVTGERIDQGVDYAGSGSLVALGAGHVTYVARSETGWPGAFIEYQLSSGPDAGCYVYYAEGVDPVRGLHVGQAVRTGQALASLIPGWASGVELGWGAGVSTKTYAAQRNQWNARRDADSVASGAGKDFSALVASLGGPAGRVEG